MEKEFFRLPEFCEMLAGHILFILSGILYSVAWILNGDKDFMTHNPEKIFFGISLLAGIAGAVLITISVAALSSSVPGSGIQVWHVLVICLIFSIVAFTVITRGFGRIVTSEIFLIVIWMTIDACAVCALSRNNWFSVPGTITSIVLLLITTAVSLVCYTIHYILQGQARFINGLIPYFTVSVTMIVNIVFLLMPG